jgi:hypothetical protein
MSEFRARIEEEIPRLRRSPHPGRHGSARACHAGAMRSASLWVWEREPLSLAQQSFAKRTRNTAGVLAA